MPGPALLTVLLLLVIFIVALVMTSAHGPVPAGPTIVLPGDPPIRALLSTVIVPVIDPALRIALLPERSSKPPFRTVTAPVTVKPGFELPIKLTELVEPLMFNEFAACAVFTETWKPPTLSSSTLVFAFGVWLELHLLLSVQLRLPGPTASAKFDALEGSSCTVPADRIIESIPSFSGFGALSS